MSPTQEAGCSGELDDTEQTSWLLFLTYSGDLEHERAQEAEVRGETHEPVIDNPDFRWSARASPRDASGNRLTEHELIGDDLKERAEVQRPSTSGRPDPLDAVPVEGLVD